MPNILIVEDKDSMRNMLHETLTEEGYRVDSAANGKQAFDLVSNKSYDLVLTDLRMPEVDGLTLLNKVKELDSRYVGDRHDRLRHDRGRGRGDETGGVRLSHQAVRHRASLRAGRPGARKPPPASPKIRCCARNSSASTGSRTSSGRTPR